MNFPRMKVRGARNRRKSAERRVNRHEFVGFPRPFDGGVRFEPHPFGSHRLVYTEVRDGCGRTVHEKTGDERCES